eukprot:gnl/Dysnectes_brevis/4455_a5995_1044.p1 GENE.gnl/Dysnectes_brevis/4455_a5995_1044~~gnl/Dysnectes_brevis/4455_a5995_1044.p1  ORF type:complete len:325 (-),score=48.73 gnl/Dysnectes_brevis/4455_a5995_1044:40-1014(-)
MTELTFLIRCPADELFPFEVVSKELLSLAPPSISIHLVDSRVHTEIRTADFLVLWGTHPEWLSSFAPGSVKAVFSLGAGVDHIITHRDALPRVSADSDLPVPVIRLTDDVLAQRMAQTVCHSVLSVVLRQQQYKQQQCRKEWKQHVPRDHLRVGLLGCGRLGQASLKPLRMLLPNIRCYSTSLARESGQSLISFLSVTDILVVLLPLTADTHHLLNNSTLRSLPKGAHLINLSRGAVVNTEDLITCVVDGHISSAHLDVFESEPLSSSSRLWSLPQVTITPHVAAVTDEASFAREVGMKMASVSWDSSRVGEIDLGRVDLHKGY